MDYNTNNIVTHVTVQKWATTAWENYEKYVYNRNTDDKLTEFSIQTWLSSNVWGYDISAEKYYFIYEEDTTTSINEVNGKQNIVTLYPNPTPNVLNISTYPQLFNTAIIYDYTGKQVLTITQKEGVHNTSINTSSFPKGNYLILLKGKKFTASKPFIVY